MGLVAREPGMYALHVNRAPSGTAALTTGLPLLRPASSARMAGVPNVWDLREWPEGTC